MYTSLAETFILSATEVEQSPSRRDGVSKEIENQLRLYGCELIQEGGCLLRKPQVVMATGQVLFHRFFCKQSMVKFSVKVRVEQGWMPIISLNIRLWFVLAPIAATSSEIV